MNKFLTLFVLIFITVSCSTYTITPESFKEQFMAAGSKMDTVKINNPFSYSDKITYRANNIKKLTVIDKQGLINYIENSPSLEMRVTQKNGKKRILYFDTVELRNDTLYGSGSKLLRSGLNRRIPFDSIVKIEIQDGGKNYYYQN